MVFIDERQVLKGILQATLIIIGVCWLVYLLPE